MVDTPMADQDLPQLIPAAPPGSSPLETVPTNEAIAIATIADLIASRIREAAKTGPAIRDAHPKAHGCVSATLRILDGLPDPLAQGLFARPRSYPCWVRFSNGSGTPQADKIGDGRGMAIKVMDVDDSRSKTQDFILINNPVFFVRDASDYVAFQSMTKPLHFFLPSLNPFRFRLHELFAALGITRRKVNNPVDEQYWSMTPYLIGELACKFSCRPNGPASPFSDRSSANFLHDNLVATLNAGDVVFEFCVQLRSGAKKMPIEDPTITWSEQVSPFVPVAHLTIARQVFDTPERIAFGEGLSFSPWHGLDAHRPLGGINRVRRTVYETISKLRHELTNTPRVEPTGE